MKRIRLALKERDGAVTTFDLAIVREDGSVYEAGPDDHYELFLQGDAVMRLYIRDGKKLSVADFATVMTWLYCRYLPEVEMIERGRTPDGEPVH
jgi:hypothetical protein